MTKPEQLASKGLIAKIPSWIGRGKKGICTSILVVSDCFSKFSRFFLLRKSTAKSVVDLLAKEIILLLGVPQLFLHRFVEQHLTKTKEGSSRVYNLRRRHVECSPGDLV